VEVVKLTAEPALKPAQDDRRMSTRGSPADTASPSPASTAAAQPSFPHYEYHSPVKPPPGNRTEAERPFAQGAQAQAAHHLSEAIQSYRLATQLDPAYYEAYYNLGLALLESGDLPHALRAYETALALRPASLDARYNFALALEKAGYLGDAASELEKLLAAYPHETRAHLALANLYAQQLHQSGRARAHYAKVLEEDPHHPQADLIRYWMTDNPKN